MRPRGLSLLSHTCTHDRAETVEVEHVRRREVQAVTRARGRQVRRFSRYVLGEGLEKRSMDFAAEVAAQTGQA